MSHKEDRKFMLLLIDPTHVPVETRFMAPFLGRLLSVRRAQCSWVGIVCLFPSLTVSAHSSLTLSAHPSLWSHLNGPLLVVPDLNLRQLFLRYVPRGQSWVDRKLCSNYTVKSMSHARASQSVLIFVA